ncbi:Nn.00g101470.m01.CDS01 [Neocucurbitaria sp. VM-36]
MNGLGTSSSTHLQPRIHYASAIRCDPALEQSIRNFVNEGYTYIAPKDASRWESDNSDRLPTADSINRELGQDGFFAVMYDPNDNTKPIACAATTRWKCDLEGGGVGDEGWEIKIVTSGAGWMRGGFAARCVDAIVKELQRQNRESAEFQHQRKVPNERKLQVWIQTVECVNGAYWKKKGWTDVRAYEKPVGHWGSKEGYRLLVLLQEFEL